MARERARLARAAAGHGYAVAPSQAHVLWLALPGVDGAEVARRLEREGVIVAPGGPLGDAARVRLTVPPRHEQAERALRALVRAATPAGTAARASRTRASGTPDA